MTVFRPKHRLIEANIDASNKADGQTKDRDDSQGSQGSQGICPTDGGDMVIPTGLPKNKITSQAESTSVLASAQLSEVFVLAVRRYDISIVYDNFYRVPRMFLRGYDPTGTPLSAARYLHLTFLVY